MSKILEFGQDAQGKMLTGVTKLARAVKTTLGPRGRNVVIQNQGARHSITKDGVTVAQAIHLKDPFEDMGAQILKQVASQTNDVAGDGTTTATVLGEAIYSDGMRRVSAGADPMALKRGIEKASEAILGKLQELSRDVGDNREIKQVATISANGDTSIGDIIADAMDQVGKDGVISLEEGQGRRESSLRVTSGFEFDRGYIHQGFINDVDKQRVVFNDPVVWLIDGKLSSSNHMHSIMPILEQLNKDDKELLLIAEDIEGEVLATLVVNRLRGSLKVAAVKAPGFGDSRKEMLKDLAALTGAQLRDAIAGDDAVEDTSLDELGSAKQVVLNKDSTVIVGHDDRVEDIENRVNEIRALIDDETSNWDRERTEKRLAKLTGGVAVIEVGAASEVEMKERKDRFEDALNATRAAVEEGVVPGGGIALARTAVALKGFKLDNHEEQVGADIMLKAITSPLMQIAENAGQTGEIVLNNVVQQDSPGTGYDALNNKYVDMFEEGIIDPTKVTRVALENAVSVASTMLTTECAIADEPADEQQANPQMMM